MIVETCEAATLVKRITAPNVITVASSQKGAALALRSAWSVLVNAEHYADVFRMDAVRLNS